MIHDFATVPRDSLSIPERKPKKPFKVTKSTFGIVFGVCLGTYFFYSSSTLQPQGIEEFKPGIEESNEFLASSAKAKVSPVELMKADDASFEQSVSPYGFYESLPESSWGVPVHKGIYVTEDDRKKATYTYILQAASLRDRADATRLVDTLKRKGLPASLALADTSDGWVRVNVGPFNNISKMNKAEDLLVSLNMMPLKRRID